jgi:hypothetical protein
MVGTARSSGLAALAICESILLSLRENGILSAMEIEDSLSDAVKTLQKKGIANNDDDALMASELVANIRDGKDGLRD